MLNTNATSSYRAPRTVRGFTLIETMVVVAISAVLAGLAAPSFTSMVQRFRVDTAFDSLTYTIQLARTEAIRTGRQVNVQSSVCGFNDWGCGWIVYADLNQNNLQDLPAEPTIRQFDPPDNIRITKNNVANLLSISRFGQFAAAGNTTYLIGPRGTRFDDCKSLVLNTAMRQSSVTAAASCPP